MKHISYMKNHNTQTPPTRKIQLVVLPKNSHILNRDKNKIENGFDSHQRRFSWRLIRFIRSKLLFGTFVTVLSRNHG